MKIKSEEPIKKRRSPLRQRLDPVKVPNAPSGTGKPQQGKETFMETNKEYDHYIAVDWSIQNMAIARMTTRSNKITVVDVPSDIEELKASHYCPVREI